MGFHYIPIGISTARHQGSVPAMLVAQSEEKGDRKETAMLATIAGFLKILALFGLIGLALFAVMMWVGAYLQHKRALKKDPKQLRGWNKKDN